MYLAALCLIGLSLDAKQKSDPVDPNDPTIRLFQLLDGSYGGKLDFYTLADVYPDPKNSGQESQRIVRLEYDKNRSFGRLKVSVRNVAKLQPEQMKTYSPKMIYEFGVEDTERFVKTEPGPLGRTGDLYLRSNEDRPVATTPITDDARKSYQRLVVDYLLPALQKK
jgi:hypothetical protein